MNTYLLIDFLTYSEQLIYLKISKAYIYPLQINQSIKNINEERRWKPELIKNYGVWLNVMILRRGLFMGIHEIKDTQEDLSYYFRDELENIVRIRRRAQLKIEPNKDQLNLLYLDVSINVLIGSLMLDAKLIDRNVDLVRIFGTILEYLVQQSEENKHLYMVAYNLICTNGSLLIKGKGQGHQILSESPMIQYILDKLLEKQVEVYQSRAPCFLLDGAPGPIYGKRRGGYPSEIQYMEFEYRKNGYIEDFRARITKGVLSHVHCNICDALLG
jgi:hypothetical protein